MKSKQRVRRFIIPRVPSLRVFLEVVKFGQTSDEKLSKKCKEFLKLIIDNEAISNITTLEDLKREIIAGLDRFLDLRNVFNKIRQMGLPVNKNTLFRELNQVLSKKGYKISMTQVKNLLSLLRKLDVIKDTREYVFCGSTHDLIQNIIYVKGSVTISELTRFVKNREELTKVILDLWAKKVVKIILPNGELFNVCNPQIIEKYGISKIPADLINENSPCVQIYVDRTDGKKYAQILLPDDAVVKIWFE